MSTKTLQDYINDLIIARDDFLAYRLINNDENDLTYIEKRELYETSQQALKFFMESNSFLKCLVALRSIGWL